MLGTTGEQDRLAILRDAARRSLRRNAFSQLRQHDGAMPWKVFAAILGALVVFRLGSIAVLYAAHAGWLLDPRYWVDGAVVGADHATPFHGHPNPFGWRFGFQGLVVMHIVTGIGLFAVCLLPLFTSKGKRWHMIFGRAFVGLWLLHLFNGLVNSAQILLVRGFDPTRYPQEPGQGFSLYLYVQFAFISFLVIDFLAHGLAAVHYKNRPPSGPIRIVMLSMPLTSLAFGLALVVWSLLRLTSDAPAPTRCTEEFAVIYLVQVPAYLYLIGKNIAYWARCSPRQWLHGWLTEHQRNMMFCVQVTLYTGLANTTMRYADWLTPVIFVAIDGGFIIWLLTKERSLRRRIVESRLGLALVMLLRDGPAGPYSRRPLSAADQRFVVGLVDADGSGALEREEVRALLEKGGLAPAETEIDQIFTALDEDDDGVIGPEELRGFLVNWFAPTPKAADELALAFRTLDRNGDGLLSPRELCAALDDGKDGLSRSEVAELLALVDFDGDGFLDFDEFQAALMPQADATLTLSGGEPAVRPAVA